MRQPVRGISLFLVPVPAADGGPGERNVRTVSVSTSSASTAADLRDGLRGCDRLSRRRSERRPGRDVHDDESRAAGRRLEGLAVSERSYQRARDYARERVQGRVPGIEGRAVIIHHADVRRMLLTMKAYIEAMRSLAYVTAAELDLAHRHPDAEKKALHQARVDLLTPVVRAGAPRWASSSRSACRSTAAWATWRAGGRPARCHITTSTGTTGIQANDLVGRKILRDGGRALKDLLAEMRALDADLARHGSLQDVRAAHAEGCAAVEAAASWLAANHASHPAVPGAVSFNQLMLIGTVAGGWQLARAAVVAAAARARAEPIARSTRRSSRRPSTRNIMPLAVHTPCDRGGADALLELPEKTSSRPGLSGPASSDRFLNCPYQAAWRCRRPPPA